MIPNSYRSIGGLPWGWWFVLVVLGHVALVGWGALSQARRALLGSLRERAHRAEAEQGRRVAEALRDTEPADDETAEPPQPVLADLPRLIAESRDTGARIELRNQVADQAAPPAATGRTVYRVVQEALTNARKHATGLPVLIDIDGMPGARLTIDIRNPLPTGPVAPSAIPGSGTGLVGLTERVRLAGGQLDHQATVGEFRLRAWLPWPA